MVTPQVGFEYFLRVQHEKWDHILPEIHAKASVMVDLEREPTGIFTYQDGDISLKVLANKLFTNA